MCVSACLSVSVCVASNLVIFCYLTFPGPSLPRRGALVVHKIPKQKKFEILLGILCVFVVLAQSRKQACSDILLPSCRAPNGSATGSGSSGCMACGSPGTAGRASSWRGLGGSGAVLPAQLWAQPECRRNQKNLENHSGVGA